LTYYIDINDKRNKVVFRLLQQNNKNVKSFDNNNIKAREGDVIIFAPNKKWERDEIEKFPNDVIIFAGKINTEFLELFDKKHIDYNNILDDETFAIKNANLTCEGVLSILISESPKSIYENKILILGAGRIAKGMCILLSKLGVDYAIASFNQDKFPQNYLYATKSFLGYDFLPYLRNYDIVINTIPAKIFDEKKLEFFADDSLYIETASVDGLEREKAQSFRFIPAPALPQKFSCETAGKLVYENVEATLRRKNEKL